MLRSKYYTVYCLVIFILVLYNILSFAPLLGKNVEITSLKLLKISPYKFYELNKLHQKYFDFVSLIAGRNNKSIAIPLDLSKDKNLLNMKVWNYRNSKIFYDLARDREKYSYLDVDYWNFIINYKINNRIFNADFNNAFLNAVYLSKYNKSTFMKYKLFYFKNLTKFSKENKIKMNRLLNN